MVTLLSIVSPQAVFGVDSVRVGSVTSTIQTNKQTNKVVPSKPQQIVVRNIQMHSQLSQSVAVTVRLMLRQ